MKQKICMITDTGWWDTDITVLPYLKVYFDIEVYLIAAKDNNKFTPQGLADFQAKHNIKVTVWERANRIRNPLNMLRYINGFNQIKKNNDKNTILYYAYIYDPYINILMYLVKSYKKLISIHDYEEHAGLNNRMRKVLKDMILKDNRFFHFFSEEELGKFKLDYPQKEGFYTQMPLKNFGHYKLPGNTSVHKNGDKKVLLFFGFIRHYKGLDLLLKALSKLNRTDYILKVAGAADNWEEYRELIEANPFVIAENKFLKDEEIPEYFAEADYLVLPYRDATQSGPVLIGMHYNVPVIASDLPCFKTYITDGESGYLFKTLDEDSLKQSIEQALDATPEQYKLLKEGQARVTAQIKSEEENTGQYFLDFINKHINGQS